MGEKAHVKRERAQSGLFLNGAMTALSPGGGGPGSWERKDELVTGYTIPVSVRMTVIATPVSQPLS